LTQTLAAGRTNFQLGNNQNLFDWTYVDNVTHAHLLASDKLETRGYDVRYLSAVHLPRVLGEEERPERPVPTSENRPSVSGAEDYARRLPSTLSKETLEEDLNVRPVVRNKYDQFFHLVHPDIASPGSPLPEMPLEQDFIPVAGEAFFVTNGQPIPFWDFPRALWKLASPKCAQSTSKPWVISKDNALLLASAAETYGWITGKDVQLTKFKVTFSCATRYYNIEKARRVLGYEPRVGMTEAVKRSVDWWLTTDEGKAFTAKEQGQ
jgi:sterol-4alpha-carboxylate 3-dehydrogenase (decarboxylating)